MRDVQCVDIRNKEERLEFIKVLETNGYTVDE